MSIREELMAVFGITEADVAAAAVETDTPCVNCGNRWYNRDLPCKVHQVCNICDGRGREDDHPADCTKGDA